MSVYGSCWVVYACAPSGEQGDPRANLIGVGATEEIAREIQASWARLNDYTWVETKQRWEKRQWGNLSVIYCTEVPFIDSHPLAKLAELGDDSTYDNNKNVDVRE